MDWFTVDRRGLAKLVAGRGMAFIVFELLQNAFDEDGVTNVVCNLKPVEGRPEAILTISDDSPNGFRNLSDAWTLFAESYKKTETHKRGRFNLGEKLVLALCLQAEISTTTGSVTFDEEGRHVSRKKSDRGTHFSAWIRMTREQYEQVCRDVATVMPPPGINTVFNNTALGNCRAQAAKFECDLPTVFADAEGNLRNTVRKTLVEVYYTLPDEQASIYEMGIPVVPTGDKFHVNVMQKVPLNMDRDNVTPAYLRTLRVEVVNHTRHLIDEARANSTEVQEATSDKRVDPAVMHTVLDKKFGEKRFVFDPSDPEANKRLVSEGYAPIMGGSLNSTQWGVVRDNGLATPAGKLSPSPECYSANGRPENVISEDKWTPKMKIVAAFAKTYAMALMGVSINVQIVREPGVFWNANYGSRTLTINYSKLGKMFFENFPGNRERAIDLFIHEFGHEYSSDHLSTDYFHSLTKLGAKSTILALTQPELFNV